MKIKMPFEIMNPSFVYYNYFFPRVSLPTVCVVKPVEFSSVSRFVYGSFVHTVRSLIQLIKYARYLTSQGHSLNIEVCMLRLANEILHGSNRDIS